MQKLEGLAGINMSSSAVLQMLDKYTQGTSSRRANLRLLNFANEGTFRLAKFAHDTESWHIGEKRVVVVALDIDNKELAECQGMRVNSPPGQAKSLEYNFGSNLYDLAIDNKLQSAIDIEPSVVERLKHCYNTQTQTTEEATANFRTPAILSLGECFSAYAGSSNPKKDFRELDRFYNVLKTAAKFREQEPDVEL